SPNKVFNFEFYNDANVYIVILYYSRNYVANHNNCNVL
ncbi:unnamed protein product, partial [marine sediment metagenome]